MDRIDRLRAALRNSDFYFGFIHLLAAFLLLADLDLRLVARQRMTCFIGMTLLHRLTSISIHRTASIVL